MEDYSDNTDEELLRKYQLERNPSFLNIIFSRYTDVGFRTALRYMRNSSDAEDVLQLAFIQFLQNLHTFREGSTTVKPWLMKMIVNASICKIREEKQRVHRQQKVASQKFSHHQGEVGSNENTGDQEVLIEKVHSCVDSLPEKYRSPIWMILCEGFSYPEVATILALPEKTVRTQVSRGLEKLRQILVTNGAVLSIDSILVLIASSKLELAPLSLKGIINSPQFFESATSKVINVASQSRRVLVTTSTKSSLLSFKFFLILTAITLGTLSGLYFLNQNKTNTLSGLNKEEKIISENINKTWAFENKNDRNLTLLEGQWNWDEKLNGMVTPIGKNLIVALPVIPQEKTFMIETIMIASLQEVPSSDLKFNFLPCWTKGKVILEHETFLSTKHFDFKPNAKKLIKSFFYKNYVFIFVEDQLLQINKYSVRACK